MTCSHYYSWWTILFFSIFAVFRPNNDSNTISIQMNKFYPGKIYIGNWRFELFDFELFRVWPWRLIFRGLLRSEIFLSIESLYITSYLTSIDYFFLSIPFFRYLTSKFFLWPLVGTWGLTFFCYSKSHTWLPVYFLLTLSLYSRTVFKIIDFKVSRV